MKREGGWEVAGGLVTYVVGATLDDSHESSRRAKPKNLNLSKVETCI